MSGLAGEEPHRCCVDRVDGSRVHHLELSDPVGVVEAHHPDQVLPALAAAARWQQGGCHVVGFVAYDAAPAFDPAFAVPDGGPVRLPLAWFGAFATVTTATATADLAWPRPLVATGPPGGPVPGRPPMALSGWPSPWRSDLDAADHAAAVADVRRAIARGDTYLANLTTRLRRPLRSGDRPEDLYARLRAGHAGGLHVLVDAGPWAVACGSPELFVELDGGHLTTRPIKGTAPRGRWPAEDEAHAAALSDSPKERAENVMIVDLLRNDLGRLAATGSVAVPELWAVERHPALHQLTSTVTATARDGTGLEEVFGALFPCGSVTGAPKVATMALIAELERSRRGVYCGAVGLLEPGGRSTFSVAIRTAVLDRRAGMVEYGTGGGITWESQAAAEWTEVAVKAAVVTGSAPGSPEDGPRGLIETMGFDPERGTGSAGIRDLGRHLARLGASSRALGFPDPASAREMVERALVGWEVPARVRLVFDRSGEVEVACHPTTVPSALTPPPESVSASGDDADLSVVCIDPEPVAAVDASLFHKTTSRARYERRSARHPQADDVVLVNVRGEVTETTRANLAVRRGGRGSPPPWAAVCCPGWPGPGWSTRGPWSRGRSRSTSSVRPRPSPPSARCGGGGRSGSSIRAPVSPPSDCPRSASPVALPGRPPQFSPGRSGPPGGRPADGRPGCRRTAAGRPRDRRPRPAPRA